MSRLMSRLTSTRMTNYRRTRSQSAMGTRRRNSPASPAVHAPRRNFVLPVTTLYALVCLALALVSTSTYAELFAHPSRMALIGGAIPQATVRGAEFLRAALLLASVAMPLLMWMLTRVTASIVVAPERAPSPTRNATIALAGAVLVGAILRLSIASQSLWYDEISSFLSFAVYGPFVAFGSYAVPTNHVPQTIATWLAWTFTGSTSEWTIRAPALIAGIAAIPVAFALVRTLLDTRAAIIGAWVMALAPIAVIESAEARGYALVILFSMVATLALARTRRELSTRACDASVHYAVFAVACALAAWSHPVALLLPIAAGIIGLTRCRVDAHARALTLASLAAGVLALVLLAPLLSDVLTTSSDYTLSSATQPTVFSREGYEALIGLTLSWSVWWQVPSPLLLLTALLGGFMITLEPRGDTQRARAALAPLALAFVLALTLALCCNTWIYARFLLFALPMSVVAVTYALHRLLDRALDPWFISGFMSGFMHRQFNGARIALIALMTGSALASIWFYREKQPIRAAVEFVAAQRTMLHASAAAERDDVATIGLPDNVVGFYTQQLGFRATATGFLGSTLAQVITEQHPHFIIVLYPQRLDARVRATLESNSHHIADFAGWADWGHGAVEVWQANAASKDDASDDAR